MSSIFNCLRAPPETDAFYKYCQKWGPTVGEQNQKTCADMAYRVFLLCHVLKHADCDPVKLDSLITIMHGVSGLKIYHDARDALAMLKNDAHHAHNVYRVIDRVRLYSPDPTQNYADALLNDTKKWYGLLK